MVCIYCGSGTRIVNSRHQKRSNNTWRRHKCTSCGSIFSTEESVDLSKSIVVSHEDALEPFSRDKLFISIHSSLGHRKDALEAATALTETVMSRLITKNSNSKIDRRKVIEITLVVLKRFDKSAFTYYHAYHS